MPQRFEPRGSSRHSRARVREVEHLHVAVQLDEAALLGDAHVAAEVLPEGVTHRPPAEPAAVLAEMIEGDAQRSPVDEVEREVMEMRRRLADQRHHVVVGVDVQPYALGAEVVGDRHAERVAVEVAHRLELPREHVDVAELARPEAGERRRRPSDIGVGIAGGERHQLDPVPLRVGQVQVVRLVAPVRHAEPVEVRGRMVGRAALAQLERRVLVARLGSAMPRAPASTARSHRRGRRGRPCAARAAR